MNKVRSQSKQRIIDVAFEHFVLSGYEGASLSTIAETVGIRKASIYTHFKSKDALFSELLQDSLEIECEHISKCFHIFSDGKLPGETYFYEVKPRYESAITYQFLTRMAYVPPSHLIEQVTSVYELYIAKIIQLYQEDFCKIMPNSEDLEMYTDAYLGILDSLSVELLYDGRMYERRLQAMLHLYRQSIQKILECD